MLEACEDRTTPTPVVSVAALTDAPEGSAGNRWWLMGDDTSGFLMVNLSFSGTADSGDYYQPMSASFMDGYATTDLYLNTIDDSTPSRPKRGSSRSLVAAGTQSVRPPAPRSTSSTTTRNSCRCRRSAT